MDILVVLESDDNSLHRMSLEAIAAAQRFAENFSCSTAALLMGEDVKAALDISMALDVGEVLVVKHDVLHDYSSDGYAHALQQVIDQEKPRYLFMGHSYRVRDYIAKVSARTGMPFLSDTTGFGDDNGVAVFTKQVFNGRLSAEFSAPADMACLVSFQAAAFPADAVKAGAAPRRDVTVELDNAMIKTQTEQAVRESDTEVDLSAAKSIVGVGRGMAKQEYLSLAQELAAVLGAEIGCSRPVVDSGLLPASRQIGSSGQIVNPELYLALAISGSAQHVVGMKGAKTIIAINKDPEAPIFELANYGVVADVTEIIPQLIAALQQTRH